MYWLAKDGFSKSLILYVNLINVFISLMTFMILGTGYLFLLQGYSLKGVCILFIILIVFDMLFLKFNAPTINTLITVVNKIFKRNIQYFFVSTKLLLLLHAIYFIAAFCFGMGAYLMCFGVGLEVSPINALAVMSSMMISDVIGFIVIIVPGGLGVREGVMFLLLKGVSSEPLSLVLPVATRIVNMLVDIFLGTIGFILLKHFNKSKSP
jgi:uncharacterized membrane protein YbhN (UPF0104 family)